MKTFLNPLFQLAEVNAVRDKMDKGAGILALSGCVDAQKAHIIYGLSFDAGKTLVISENELTARRLYDDLRFFFPKTLFYPAKDLLFYRADITGNLLDKERMDVLHALLSAEDCCVVAPASALLDTVSTKASLLARCVHLSLGEETDMMALAETLTKMAYERCGQVMQPGQFAMRGDIFDVWPFTEETPVRVEFFGDEMESMRRFEAESQRSIETLTAVDIFPATERSGELASFLDWFEHAALFLDEPTRILAAWEATEKEFREGAKMRLEKDGKEAVKHLPEILSADKLTAQINRRRSVALSALELRREGFVIEESYGMTVQAIGAYNRRFDYLVEDVKRYRAREFTTVVLSASTTRAKRLAASLKDSGVPAIFTDDTNTALTAGQVVVMRGNLSRGFTYPLIKFAVISETDLLGAQKKKRKKQRRYEGEAISGFEELHVGDVVVHENHGVGIYRGIEQIKTDGAQKDYMKIEYRDGNLFVLATQLDVLMKYAGGDSAHPRLNKLNNQEWEKTRQRVKASVEDIAYELVDLYATRSASSGHRFPEDTTWQKEFEELFPYEETDDQLQAIEDVKRDMESDKIMDRLICGDVGYGKTEVALRACFKAVQDGKQVAFLVPTTILAQQHYNTFLQRMQNFPLRVELLCRFRTPAQQKTAIADLKKGLVDIVIGTHRLLSKDVAFKNLGLLIVDEEQRFGVTHKERIKEMRKDVDVLTLSATPIPRTLHMSLVGIRDMSVLTEPPEDRVPIQTYVLEYNEEMVREAICRELARGGQVYYVYNRVRDIFGVADRLQKLVPEARIACADGQMRERELEQIMVDFINGEIDILVTTTIIETGLDIANVNTMIIHDADRMGLSQLYQLRGRVGRSNRTAYAYLMYRRDKLLPEVAEKRLAAIREFTELGSGIKIAMRDLEIRGAGNLLGAAQHGHMDAVGYDLYCKLLSEAVKKAKGEKTAKDFETTVDIALDAFIPDTYIPNGFQKIEFYKRIAAIDNYEDKQELTDEMKDRFGDLPQTVKNLLAVAELKAEAHRASLVEIRERNGQVILYPLPDPAFDVADLPGILHDYKGKFSIHPYATGTEFHYHGSGARDELLYDLNAFCAALAASGKTDYNQA